MEKSHCSAFTGWCCAASAPFPLLFCCAISFPFRRSNLAFPALPSPAECVVCCFPAPSSVCVVAPRFSLLSAPVWPSACLCVPLPARQKRKGSDTRRRHNTDKGNKNKSKREGGTTNDTQGERERERAERGDEATSRKKGSQQARNCIRRLPLLSTHRLRSPSDCALCQPSSSRVPPRALSAVVVAGWRALGGGFAALSLSLRR
jgi:hypothetical protein